MNASGSGSSASLGRHGTLPMCVPASGSYAALKMVKAKFQSSASLLSTIKDMLDDVLHVPEASSIIAEARTKGLVSFYSTLIPDDRTVFLRTLATDYGVDQTCVLQFANNLTAGQGRTVSATLRSYERLRLALIPRYQNLFTQISRLEGGVKFLVDLRADCITMLLSHSADGDSPFLHAMNSCLRELLSLWFSVGFLALERITWESPCDMLQKISEYEAVHPIRNWTDLKRRVGPYRRCFVFTHGSMPREPVVVLHTALTSSISSSIQNIVKNSVLSPAGDLEAKPGSPEEMKEDASHINTAIFYSITSTQKGLQGVELGNYLIKSVVKELLLEFPRMHQFASLSPIPGFKDWLLGEINKIVHMKKIGEDPECELFLDNETTSLAQAIGVNEDRLLECLKRELLSNNWVKEQALADAMEAPLMRLCARYLYVEKRRGYALNPVANFHLRNGATMWRLNWMADGTPRGLSAACGMMVNYRYYLDQTENNSKAYMESQYIKASDELLALVQMRPRVLNGADKAQE